MTVPSVFRSRNKSHPVQSSPARGQKIATPPDFHETFRDGARNEKSISLEKDDSVIFQDFSHAGDDGSFVFMGDPQLVMKDRLNGIPQQRPYSRRQRDCPTLFYDDIKPGLALSHNHRIDGRPHQRQLWRDNRVGNYGNKVGNFRLRRKSEIIKSQGLSIT